MRAIGDHCPTDLASSPSSSYEQRRPAKVSQQVLAWKDKQQEVMVYVPLSGLAHHFHH